MSSHQVRVDDSLIKLIQSVQKQLEQETGMPIKFTHASKAVAMSHYGLDAMVLFDTKKRKRKARVVLDMMY